MMRPRAMGSPDRSPAFPSTRWSRLLAPGGERDLEALAQAYWQPIQAFLRARLRCGDDDASDLAQEAFAWMLASDLFAKADPARGRFRGFLKRALSNFAVEHLRRMSAQKRGGAAGHAPLEAAGEVADKRGTSPEDALDDAWRRELLERASQELQRELEGSGRTTYWSVFRDFFLAGEEQPDHATLARRHGITRTDVSNWLDYGKRRYRAILRAFVADTVSTAAELDDELRWLFGGAEPGGLA
jgi:RNA polymerase sigma-70 factor (ECF subfamily)